MDCEPFRLSLYLAREHRAFSPDAPPPHRRRPSSSSVNLTVSTTSSLRRRRRPLRRIPLPTPSSVTAWSRRCVDFLLLCCPLLSICSIRRRELTLFFPPIQLNSVHGVTIKGSDLQKGAVEAFTVLSRPLLALQTCFFATLTLVCAYSEGEACPETTHCQVAHPRLPCRLSPTYPWTRLPRGAGREERRLYPLRYQEDHSDWN